MAKLQVDIKNFKRRMKYFVSKSGGDFDTEKFSHVQTRQELNKADRALKSARKAHDLSKSIDKLKHDASDLSVKLPRNIKTERQYKKAKQEVEKVKRNTGLRSKAAVNKEAEKLMNEIQEYNATLLRKEGDKRLNLRPRTPYEVKQYRKIFELVKKGEIDKAKKMMGQREGESLFVTSVRQDSFKAIKSKDYTYRDWVFLKTSIKEAENSALPEMAKLFRDGGESLIKDLAENRFTLFEYADSLADNTNDDMSGLIIAKLESISPKLKPHNRKQVQQFIALMSKVL